MSYAIESISQVGSIAHGFITGIINKPDQFRHSIRP